MTHTSTDAVLSTDLKALLDARNLAIQEIEVGQAAIKRAVAICQQVEISDDYHLNRALSGSRYGEPLHLLRSDWLAGAIKSVDCLAWDRLMHASGLRTFMDADTRKEWDQQVADREVPALTEENIRSLFGGLLERRNDMFRTGVVNLFQRLQPRYAANSKWQFGKKLIVNHVYSRPPYSSLNRDAFDQLDDLRRAFCVLDGVPEPDHRQGCYVLAGEAVSAGESSFETPYFSVKLHKTAQTAHVKISRLDLLDKLNGILAEEYGKALPDANQGKRRRSTATSACHP